MWSNLSVVADETGGDKTVDFYNNAGIIIIIMGSANWWVIQRASGASILFGMHS